MQEDWKDIEEFDGIYFTSNSGRFRKNRTERILSVVGILSHKKDKLVEILNK